MIFIICLIFFLIFVSVRFIFHFRLSAEPLNKTKVIYCSENFIIVDKEADFKINSNRKEELTLQTFLKHKFPNVASEKLFHEFYFPHRLDYATSGVVCIPKNKDVCKVVSEAFSNRFTKKYYIALVRGLLSQNLVDINVSVGDDIRHTEIQKMCTPYEPAFCRNCRTAQTIVTVLEEGLFNNYPASKLLCRPLTGRRHQIRVHCSFLGHTIIGDYTYSNRKDIMPLRMYLHSIRLCVPNNIENIDVSTEDPFINIKGWKVIKSVQTLQLGYTNLDAYVRSLDMS